MAMSSAERPMSESFGLDKARAFVQAAQSHVARTMAENPHWYVVRFESRRIGVEEATSVFVALIRSPAGYDRRWRSSRVFRSLDVPATAQQVAGQSVYYWPMTDAPVWVGQAITEETSIIINRALLDPGEGPG